MGVDEEVKAIIRAYRSVFPHSKPSITTGYFEGEGKRPEEFTALLSDSQQRGTPMMQGSGPTLEAAAQHLRKLLAASLREIRTKEIKLFAEHCTKSENYHAQLAAFADTLAPEAPTE